ARSDVKVPKADHEIVWQPSWTSGRPMLSPSGAIGDPGAAQKFSGQKWPRGGPGILPRLWGMKEALRNSLLRKAFLSGG
ncbi:MAG TPA: hypothetical protein VMY37_31675, partial [Thermoguttaceae bacterium]|nr:hypothetical protein [Thermoguttaceae bacterium]